MTPDDQKRTESVDRRSELASLIRRAHEGDDIALGEIYKRMLERVIGLVRARMSQALSDRSASDIAASVLWSFCVHFRAGDFPDLADGNSLWRLLADMTCKKVASAYRHDQAQRRGGGVTRLPLDEKLLMNLLNDHEDHTFAVEMQELLQKLLELLPERLLAVALMRMQDGLSNEEIAAKLKVGRSTVEGFFCSIRAAWERFVQEQEGLPPK